MIRSHLSTLLLLTALAVLPPTSWAGAAVRSLDLASAASTARAPKSLPPYVPYRHTWLGQAANDDTLAVRVGEFVTFTRRTDYHSRQTALAYVIEDGGQTRAVLSGKNIDAAIFGQHPRAKADLQPTPRANADLQADDWAQFCKNDKGAALRMQTFVRKAARSKQFDHHGGKDLAGSALKKLVELCRSGRPLPSEAPNLQAYIFKTVIYQGVDDHRKVEKAWQRFEALDAEEIPATSDLRYTAFRAADPAGIAQAAEMLRLIRSALSPREFEALMLAAEGYSYSEIARSLKVSVARAAELVHDARWRVINSPLRIVEAPDFMKVRMSKTVELD